SQYTGGLPTALTMGLLVLSGSLFYAEPTLASNPRFAAIYLCSAIVASFLWKTHWRVYRYIADTATSKVATAAQGLVELHGLGDLAPGQLTQGVAMGPPCLWQSYTVTENNRVVDSGTSTSPFQIQDSSGRCVVYPEGATVISSSRVSPKQGLYQTHIAYLKPGASIYVLGELRTIGGDNDNHDVDREMGDVLRRWKTDQNQLLREYDQDGDGRIDVQEWEAARARARQVAKRNIQHKRLKTPVTHELRKPSNGLPLIISDKEPDTLSTRYFLLGGFNLLQALTYFVVGALKIS
ncbi:MAG: hypothetical protein ACPGSC_14140, partial [Granulosicoccaceae bacterium]